uniref:Uncharacterized protein n=1 Tax=viral metagenome TaxID=1070528 RepID=A0A6H2A0R2_9ZZZZ
MYWRRKLSLLQTTEDEFIKRVVVEYRNLTLYAPKRRPLLFGTGEFNVLLEALARVVYRELKEKEE